MQSSPNVYFIKYLYEADINLRVIVSNFVAKHICITVFVNCSGNNYLPISFTKSWKAQLFSCALSMTNDSATCTFMSPKRHHGSHDGARWHHLGNSCYFWVRNRTLLAP